MKREIRLAQIFGVLSAASVGDMSVRVPVTGDAPDDEVTRLAVALNVLLDDLGQRTGESERATDELRQTLGRMRGMVDASLDAVIAMDDRGHVIDWSRQAEVLFGWSREEAIARPLVDLIVPARYRDAHLAGLERSRRARDGPLGRRLELKAIARDGREFPVEVLIAPVPAAGGHVFSAFLRDITERRTAERRRRTLEALYEIAYAAGKPLDPDRLGRFIVTYARDLLSAETVTLWWATRGELSVIAGDHDAGDGPSALVLKAFGERWPASGPTEVAVPLVLHGRQVGAIELRAARPLEVGSDVVHTLEALGVQVAPLMEVARLHEELVLEQQRFGKAFERNPSGLTIARASDRRIIEANPAFLEMLGYGRDDVVGRLASEVGFTDVGMRAVRAELDRAETVRGREMDLRAQDGTTREVIASFEMAELHGEAVIFGTFLDVTGRRDAERQRTALEERVRLAERLESMGKVAGGVAHDFSNLIGVILNYASVVAEDVADRPEVKRDVEEIRIAAERAAEMTRELLAFARGQPSHPEVLDVNEVITGTRRMLERSLGGSVELIVLTNAGPAMVRADRSQIERVLMNLALNARDAMPDGGTLTIATSNVHIARAEGTLPAGRYVLLTVADTGPGMSRETAARAFDPFFTTKPSGRGTGLGLATVLAIVTEAAGTVRIDSTPGAGTVVSVLLPLAESVGTASTRGKSGANAAA